MVKTVFDTSSLENEQLKLEEELNIVADKVNNCINENVWLSMVDYLTVRHDGKVDFTFLDGGVMKIDE